MIDDIFVIDATVHGGHYHPRNHRRPEVAALVTLLHAWGHGQLQPFGYDAYKLNFEQFVSFQDLQPELLEQLLFAESDTDIAVYHTVPLYGMSRMAVRRSRWRRRFARVCRTGCSFMAI